MPQIVEAPVPLRPTTEGREVVEDYGHVGLTLRAHPVNFLREELARRRMVTCAEAGAPRDGLRCRVAGLVLMRQKPGSAKGVMFITLEDETGIANLAVWPQLFQRQRRLVLSASLMGVEGRVQREGDVVHLVAYRLLDLSEELGAVGRQGDAFSLPRGRGDAWWRPDARDPPGHRSEVRSRGTSTFQTWRSGRGSRPTRDFR